MDWSRPVDLYCERTDHSFWAEPVNAFSNAAFLIAAIVAYVQWRRASARDGPMLALISVTAAISIGSFIFHTIATRGTALFDTAPIATFIYGYLLLALRRLLNLSLVVSLAIVVAFALVSTGEAAIVPPATLNGSHAYLPGFAALLVIAWLVRHAPWGALVRAAAVLLALALIFRSIDLDICDVFPLGTHFLWHVLNGLTLYLLLIAGLRAGAAAPKIGE